MATFAELQQRWAELCEEYRAAQDSELRARMDAVRKARKGVVSADDAEEFHRAHEAVQAIRKRMDEFIEKQGGG